MRGFRKHRVQIFRQYYKIYTLERPFGRHPFLSHSMSALPGWQPRRKKEFMWLLSLLLLSSSRAQRISCFYFLFGHGFGLSSPVFGIRIKNEAALVRESQIKDQGKGQNNQEHQILEPQGASRSWMVGSKGKERYKEQSSELDLLTEDHHCILRIRIVCLLERRCGIGLN